MRIEDSFFRGYYHVEIEGLPLPLFPKNEALDFLSLANSLAKSWFTSLA